MGLRPLRISRRHKYGMAINIGSLFASLTLQSSQFTQGTREAASAAKVMSKEIKGAFHEVAAAATELFAGYELGKWMAEQIKSSFEYAVQLGETAKQVGLTTKTLQELHYAGTQMGVSTENMDQGFRKFTLSIGRAADGSAKLQEGFKKLGVSLSDLRTLSPDQILQKTIDGFAKIKDPAERARLEVEKFGKAGQLLDPMLRGGTESVEELRKAAEKLGIVLSDEEIQRAEETSHKLHALNMELRANVAKAVTDNAGAIESLATSLTNMATGLAKFWSQNPQQAMGIMGAIAGFTLGSRFGIPGAAIGATGGYMLGSNYGQSLDDQNPDIAIRKQRLLDARNQYHRLKNENKDPTSLISFHHGSGVSGDLNAAQKEMQKQTDLMWKALNQQKQLKALASQMDSAGAGGRDVTLPKGGHAKKGPAVKEDHSYQDELDALKDEFVQLGMNARQQDMYNAFQKAGFTITAEQAAALQKSGGVQQVYNQLTAAGVRITKDQVSALSNFVNEIDDGKALAEWNGKLDDAIKKAKEYADTLGMTARQKRWYDFQLLLDSHPKSTTDPDAVVVNGKNVKVSDLRSQLQRDDHADDVQDERNALKDIAQAHANFQQQLREDAHQIGLQFGQTTTQFLDDLIMGTKTFGQAFGDMVKSMGELMLQELVYKPMQELIAKLVQGPIAKLLGMLGNSIGGGLGGKAGLGQSIYPVVNGVDPLAPLGHAMGGPTSAGQPYLVGERGPELFVPSQNGAIIPNNRMSNSGAPVFNIDARYSSNPAETAAMIEAGITQAMPMLRQDATAHMFRKLKRPSL